MGVLQECSVLERLVTLDFQNSDFSDSTLGLLVFQYAHL